MLENKNIILGVCGSIAAYKSAILVRLLVKAGANVKVILTADAANFITPLTLATLSKILYIRNTSMPKLVFGATMWSWAFGLISWSLHQQVRILWLKWLQESATTFYLRFTYRQNALFLLLRQWIWTCGSMKVRSRI